MLVKILEFLIGAVMSAFGFLMLVLISLSDRIQKKEKIVPAPEASAGPSAEEAERPFPGPIIQQPALADREQGRKDYDKDFEEKRWLWAASMEAELLVMEIEEGL